MNAAYRLDLIVKVCTQIESNNLYQKTCSLGLGSNAQNDRLHLAEDSTTYFRMNKLHVTLMSSVRRQYYACWTLFVENKIVRWHWFLYYLISPYLQLAQEGQTKQQRTMRSSWPSCRCSRRPPCWMRFKHHRRDYKMAPKQRTLTLSIENLG